MPEFIVTEASLYNGISQQSPELRLGSQVSDAVNTDLSVARGVEKRPPAETVETYDGFYTEDTLIHPIDSGVGNQYLLAIPASGSTLGYKMYDTAGLEYPVIFAAGTQDYIETVDAESNFIPTEALQLSTVLDFTFICNKNVITAMDATTVTDDLVNSGYIWVRNGIQQVERTADLDGVEAAKHPKDADNDSEKVVDEFVSDITSFSGFSATKVSKSVLFVTKNGGGDFELTTSDTLSDTTMEAASTSGATRDTLPPVAEDGRVFRIIGEELSDSEHFLEFDSQTKSYSEVSAPAEATTFDATTMPHALIRKMDDGAGTVTGTPDQIYLSVETLNWVPRASGSNDTNKLPSFIGQSITDTFFFKNRLGFLSGENIILSRTDDLFNMFPATVKEVLDDDPIDISVSSNRNVALSHVAPFPDSLIVLGEHEQFSLSSGGKAFTTQNTILEPTTSYTVSRTVAPVSTGASLYFNAPLSSFSALREYSVQPDTLVTDAADVTGHVETLLPNTIKMMIPENNLEYIFLIENTPYNTEGNLLWVYKYFWQGNQKIQSAWAKWVLWFNPLGGWVYDGQLCLLGNEVFQGTERTILMKFNLRDDPPVVLDGDLVPFKSPRPSVDRLEILPDNPINIAGEDLSIEVTQEQYELLDIEDIVPIIVNRITGFGHKFVTRFTEGGKFFFIFEQAVPPTDLGEEEDLILGGYTLGISDL